MPRSILHACSNKAWTTLSVKPSSQPMRQTARNIGIGSKTKRRPEGLIRWGNSLGRREIEPESFVSSSCVGIDF